MARPLVVLDVVGLTGRLLPHAPRLSRLAAAGSATPLEEVLPAVTSTAQATMLTGKPPSEHGIVANGWLYRDTMEIRFWQQSNRLLQAEPAYATLKARHAAAGKPFKVAKLFWWFNQGAAVDVAVTPKPWYGCDGSKAFGIAGTPPTLAGTLEDELGPFPFHAFWGPEAGLPATRWIARCAAHVLKHDRPDLTLAYLPHLDYDPQRFGPSGCDMAAQVRQLDDACAPILNAAEAAGARVWVVSEYGHCDVTRPILVNRALRAAGFLTVRDGPFGETLDTFASRAFAVCDHQVAHVYVRDEDDQPAVNDLLGDLPGIDDICCGDECAELGLDHPRSGEMVLFAEPHAWFAYPYWTDDAHAPDFARTIDIHRKPGFDPCEMLYDPRLKSPRAAAAYRVLRKKLGLRYRMDVIPLDPTLIRGSHGLRAADPLDKPLLVTDTPGSDQPQPMATVHARLLEAFEA